MLFNFFLHFAAKMKPTKTARRKFRDHHVDTREFKTISIANSGVLTLMQRQPGPEEFDLLWSCKPEQRATGRMFGQHVVFPRWTMAYRHSYAFSGQTAVAQDHLLAPCSELIDRYMDWARRHNLRINGCLINWYDRDDSIGAHHDSESSLSRDQDGLVLPIVMISFGADRELVLSPDSKITDSLIRCKVKLEHGSVVVLDGRLNQTHTHAIPALEGPKGTEPQAFDGRRVSLTFRAFD